MIGNLGIYHDRGPRVRLAVVPWLATDLRDHHLISRWNRLVRRWRRG